MEKDGSSYTNEDTSSYTEKGERPQQLATLNRSTPLHFTLRVNGQYYISYEQKQFWWIIIRSIAWIIINVIINKVVNNLQNAGDTLKSIVSYGLIAQNVLYILLCFLDPGTLFEDEEDTYNEQRTLCMTCSVYKLRSSRHCIWCNKCAKNYDHHCSVFGKCIAKRNLILFYAFILVSGLQMPCIIITLIYNLAGTQ